MSDKEQNGAAAGADDSTGGMTSADVSFLVTCLQNTTGGSISVDYNKVADALGYKNPKSVANKVSAMKKKFDLPIGTSAGKGAGTPDKVGKTPTPRKASDTAGPNDPAIPKTPSKTRVTKPRATSSTKKKATLKGKNAKAENDDEETIEDPVDEAADTKEAYEQVFGKDEDDEGDVDEDVEDENEDSHTA